MKVLSWRLTLFSTSIICILLTACQGAGGRNDSASTTSDTTSTTTILKTTLPDWIMNTGERSTTIFESDTKDIGVMPNVQLAQLQTTNSVEYIYIEASGIPNYVTVITDETVEGINNRPNVSRDLVDGVTSASAGDTVTFGDDIGYDNGSSDNCSDTGGTGYFPPGPECPTDQNLMQLIPANPTKSSESCGTSVGPIGLMINGANIFGWGDGMSYRNNSWYQLAAQAEFYAVDICGGHAGVGGTYHHHFYSSCMADLVNDDGSGHSPLYGYVLDGYPIYGPYESAGELAISGWVIRDFGAPVSEGGCDTAGERSCILVDEYDVSQGVDTSVRSGPDIGEDVQVGPDTYAANSGFYYEDYYYAQAEATGSQLDEHNGHDNNDGRGYHYHITVTDENGTLAPAFPHTAGPLYRGEVATCR